MKRRGAPKVFKWLAVSHVFTLLRHTDGRQLGVFVIGQGGERWSCTAAEVPAGVTTGAQALDNHAHQIVGSFHDQAAAMLAGETYARAWAASSAPAELCPCEDIGLPVDGAGRIVGESDDQLAARRTRPRATATSHG